MKPKHPFEFITPSSRKSGFYLSLIFTLGVMVALNTIDTHLKSSAAPNGILSFEFSGTIANARAILGSWGEKGQVYAGLSLGIDYLFLVLYPFTIGLACVLTGEKLSNRLPFLQSTGPLLAWGLIIAGVMDSVENYALIKILSGAPGEFSVLTAMYCASIKFTLVGLGLLYIISGTITGFFIKR